MSLFETLREASKCIEAILDDRKLRLSEPERIKATKALENLQAWARVPRRTEVVCPSSVRWISFSRGRAECRAWSPTDTGKPEWSVWVVLPSAVAL